MSDNQPNGIVKPLRERVKDLEEINEAHQKKKWSIKSRNSKQE